jgi:thiamine kinase-like enzyme
VSADELAGRVWPGGVDRIEPLGGGITNRNFKVTVAGEAFVLRVGGRDTARLGIDREVERAASVAAAAIGIGPEVVAFLEPEGYLVTRFVEGRTGEVAPAEAARLLLLLHTAAPIPGRFDPFRVVEAYAATARATGVPLPPAYEPARAIAGRIERRLPPAAPAPCHNDLLAANFVRSAQRLWIVDWEYAGMGDPAFDLANFAVNNGLDADGDRELLEAYGAADRARHTLLRYMSDLREAMWGVVQQAVSELDFDFAGYADEHFTRLEQAAAEPRFRRALA